MVGWLFVLEKWGVRTWLTVGLIGVGSCLLMRYLLDS
jgi:hypothetical protein